MNHFYRITYNMLTGENKGDGKNEHEDDKRGLYNKEQEIKTGEREERVKKWKEGGQTLRVLGL